MATLIYILLLISSLLFAQETEQTNKIIKAIKEQPELLEKLKETTEEEIENKTEEEISEKEIGKRISPKKEGIPYGTPYGTPKAPSAIELMFQEKFPLEVSKNIFQFGYDIFGPPSTTFAAVENYTVPPKYVLGPDDEIIINIWGKVQETIKVKIDRDGKIILPKAGVIYLLGLEFEKAQELITKQLNTYYSNIEVNITLGRLKSIKVFLLGNVTQPGSYTISSLSTVFHALHNAGGPTRLGSMRNIEVNTHKKIDLYDLLLYGNKETDYPLSSGDIIYVHQIGKVVGIAGSVKRPAIYEVKDTETLKDIIEMAGGITSIGYLKQIQIERIKEHEHKVVLDLKFTTTNEFNTKAAEFRLQDGDLILISPIISDKHNYVSIKGNIQRPGNYELKPGMRIKDLIEEADGLYPGTYFERAEVSRFKTKKIRETIPINLELALKDDTTHNLQLMEWDEVTIYTETDIFPVYSVKINGAVCKPGEYTLTPNMTIEDLIFRAGGLFPTADLEYSELYKMNQRKKQEVRSIDLQDSIVCADKLGPGDMLFIRERKEWACLPSITLSGEVVRPGTYVIHRNEKILSVIERAGGFTKYAFLPGAVLTRQLVKQYQQEATQKFVEEARKKMLGETGALETTKISEEERRNKEEFIKYRKEIIDAIAKTESPGRIVIDFSNLASPENNITVENGDKIDIPIIPNTVQIVGCVYNPSAITYRENAGISWYLTQVGGATKEGDKGEIYILKASGQVTKGDKIGRGDAIIVPEKQIRRPVGDIIKDVAQILYQLGFSAIAISAIIATNTK
ncbi:MAG: SLBB domain-containing protein [Candidatus Stahlbacteria bacterium]|nr:SLBB domain-containing protein [Candidatus Stahlbacteria bacterium]